MLRKPHHEFVDTSRSWTTDRNSKLKALAEVALVHRLAGRLPWFNQDATLARLRYKILKSLPPVVDSDRSFLTQLRLSLALEACGVYSDVNRERLAFAFAREFEKCETWRAWNAVELRYYLDLLDIPHQIPELSELYYDTLLFKQNDVSAISHGDAYQLTHIIFAMSDFGRQSLRPIFKNEFDRNCEYVCLLLKRCVVEQDWDLVAELLAVCACLKHIADPIFTLGWEKVERLQQPSGRISRRVSRGDRLIKAVNGMDDFHATIATSVAAILALELIEGVSFPGP
jgi:hypothetical protein